MVYRDVSDGKLKIRYGDLWKFLATIAVIIITLITYKTSIDSSLNRLDYVKADKEKLNEMEKKYERIDEKLNTIYEYIKEQKASKK